VARLVAEARRSGATISPDGSFGTSVAAQLANSAL
jgi:hypothetical protein